MSRICTKVDRVADWAGWCSPCEREDRPLVLTRSGPAGIVAWLAGLGDDDRLLLLTCRVCGSWQLVPAREEDDPEVLLVQDGVLEAGVLEADVLEAGAEQVAATGAGAPAAPEPVPVEAPAAVAVPEPRVAVERIVTVPATQTATPPAVSQQAVAAAAAVLSAARAQTGEPADRRSGTVDRHRARRGPTPRRSSDRLAAVRAELAPVLGLPTGTRQVVLAAAG